MPVPSSGAISLNDFHVEAGGTSGTQCSINDSDIRGLISKSSATTMSFNEWYGASNIVQYSAPIVVGSATFVKATSKGFIQDPTIHLVYNAMGTLNGSTSAWSFGGLSIAQILTEDTGGAVTHVQIRGTLTATNWTSITYQTSAGSVTMPASAFSYSAPYITNTNAGSYTNGGSHIINGTVTITV